MFLEEKKTRGCFVILLVRLSTFITPSYAQICEPPYAITDGSFDPIKEEYTDQEAVRYQCNDIKYALIGESSIVCQADGNWSSDPPECRDVECPNPYVDNAKKVSGSNGPFYYNYAVRFECAPGFTMKGDTLVKCNAGKQWDPPLPTCSKGDVAAVTGHGIVIFTMILLGHVINPHF